MSASGVSADLSSSGADDADAASECSSIAAALLISTPLHSAQSYPFPLQAWWRARDNAQPSAPSPPERALPILSDDECLQLLLFRQFAMARRLTESAERHDSEMRRVATSAYLQWMEARRTIREQQETILRQSEIIRQLTLKQAPSALAEQPPEEAQATIAAPSSPALSVSAASPPSPPVFSAPAISLSLVQCFLLLPEVGRSMRISRVWSAAALDPIVWSHRDTSAHLAHSRRLGLCDQCSPGGSCSSSLSVHEQVWAASRLLIRCPSIHWARSHPMPAADALDHMAGLLPKLTSVRFERLCSTPELAAALVHPLFLPLSQLDCIVDKKTLSSPPAYAAPGTRVLPEPNKHQAWRTMIRAIARSCLSLKHLTIRLHENAVLLAPDLAFLCEQLPELHSLSVWSSVWCLPDLPRPMLELRSLRADLTVEQVEHLCAHREWLPRLHTADLIIAGDTENHGELDPTRLSCLAALPSLTHLTLRLPSCALDPLLFLRAVQRRGATAFQQLRSLTCVVAASFGGCSYDGSSAGSSPRSENEEQDAHFSAVQKQEDGLDDVRAAATSRKAETQQELQPFPNLRFVHLSCCHSRLLSDERQLATLCAAIPIVHTLALRLHPSDFAAFVEFSLAWCECPALQSLRQLSSLIVDLHAQVTLDSIRAPMLPQLHSLARLPNLISFEFVDVIRLNRRELQDLMTLRPLTAADDEAAPTEDAQRATSSRPRSTYFDIPSPPHDVSVPFDREASCPAIFEEELRSFSILTPHLLPMSDSLKRPLMSEAELQPAQHRDEPLQHSVALGAPAAPPAASSGLFGHFVLLFPDVRSRILFLLCLLASIALSIVWLVNTVQSKWLYSIHHPQQFVSYERVDSLPAFFGHAITYFQDILPQDSVLLRFVTTKFQYNNAAQLFVNSFIQCAPGYMFYPLTLCQPADAQGNPFLSPAPGELDGASALGMQATLEDKAQWPLQFGGSTDALCLTSFVFLNFTKLPSFIPLSQMVFALVPLSLTQLLAMEEHMAVGANIPSDPRMWSLVNSLTSPTVMQYQQRHLIRLTATKTVHTNGEHEWSYAYNSGKDLNLMDVDLQSYADSMLNITAGTDPALHAQILALLPGAAVGQWNHTDIKLLISDVCFTPSSYTVQVVRETSTYGAISFLSDLGGFANLVSLVMLALFPLAVNVVRPRSFVVLWLSDKWAARTKRKEAEARATAQAGLLRGHVGLQAID